MKHNDARPPFLLYGIIASFILLSTAACSGGNVRASLGAQMMTGGDPERGRLHLEAYGCGSCHAIPGVNGADAYVGPPLINWSDRSFIAGSLPNTADNLIFWIRYPQSVEPGTAMPDLNVPDDVARDMGAYLYTLKRAP